MDRDFEPARIADRLEIQDVIYRWCRAVDRLDRQGLLNTFHPDAVERHGDHVGTAVEVIDSIVTRHQSIPFVSHLVGNVLIEFAGTDVALVETYMRNIRRLPADSPELAKLLDGRKASFPTTDLFTASRFVDRFERRAGRWRVAERTLVQDWRRLVEVSAHEIEGPAPAITGRRDRFDPVYLARDALGIRS